MCFKNCWLIIKAFLRVKPDGEIGNHRLVRISHDAACREGIIAGLTIIAQDSDGDANIYETPDSRQKR